MFVPVSQHIFHVLNLPLQLSRHNSLLWSCATKMTISKTNRPGPGSIREMGQYGKWVFTGHLSPNSHAILTQCSVNSHLMLSQFSTNAHSILNLCSCKYHPIFTYNAQWNVNIVDWYVDWIRNCIKLIVYYHNHENTSHFDCLSTHLYIQDWNPCARSSAKPTNSLASDSIQWHGSGSTLARLMAWCLMAPSHHLYQYWLLITTVQWDSSEGSFTRDALAINHWN